MHRQVIEDAYYVSGARFPPSTVSSLIPVWACNAANGEHRATFEFIVEGFPIFGVPLKGAMGDKGLIGFRVSYCMQWDSGGCWNWKRTQDCQPWKLSIQKDTQIPQLSTLSRLQYTLGAWVENLE